MNLIEESGIELHIVKIVVCEICHQNTVYVDILPIIKLPDCKDSSLWDMSSKYCLCWYSTNY